MKLIVPGAPKSAAIDLLREARIAGRLAHPNIVPMYALGRREDGGPALLMNHARLVRRADRPHSRDPQGIRDETRQTKERLDQTNQRLDDLREELSKRIVESEMPTATAITKLAGSINDLAAVLRSQADLRPRVEQCERDIVELKQRVG